MRIEHSNKGAQSEYHCKYFLAHTVMQNFVLNILLLACRQPNSRNFKMEKIRLWLAFLVAIGAIVLMLSNIFSGNWLASFMYLLWGICLFFTIGGFDHVGYFKAACGVPALISFYLIFEAFPSQELQSARSETQRVFQTIGLDASKCKGTYDKIQKVQELGFKTCAAQGWIDFTGSVGKAVEAIYLPPSVAIAKDLAEMNAPKKPDNCARVFVTAAQLCPAAFEGFDPASRRVLERAAEPPKD